MPTLKPAADPRAARGCGVLFCTIWLGFCVFWCFAALGSRQPQMILCAIPHIAVGVGLLFWIVKPAVMALKVGAPEVEISSDVVHTGDRFQFRFRQPVRQMLDVDRIAVRFLFRESASYSQGTTNRTDTNDQLLWEWEQPRTHFEAGQSIDLEQSLQILPGAMHSFSAMHNKLQYLVQVHVAIAGWPDFKEDYEVQVAPERAG